MAIEMHSYLPNFQSVILVNATHYKQSAEVTLNKPFPIPPYYERVEVMTDGRGWIQSQGEWREVLPGDIIWNRPGDCTIGRSDTDTPYRCLAVSLTTKKKNGLGMPRFSHYADLEEIRNFTYEVSKLAAKEEFNRLILRDYVVSRLLLWMAIHEQELYYRKFPLPLQWAMDWIELHFHTPCRLKEIAQACGWSIPHLHENFQQHLRQTPRQFIIVRRLQEARKRLTGTRQPIKQIAAECGFYDTSAFIHAFKRHLKITPNVYRQQHAHLRFQKERNLVADAPIKLS